MTSYVSKNIASLNAKHRIHFMQKMRYKFRCSPEDAEDLFQDAMLVLCEKLSAGKLSGSEDYLYFYLLRVGYMIGRRKSHAKIAEGKCFSHIGGQTSEPAAEMTLDDEKSAVVHTLNCLKTQSKRLLQLYYFDGYCMEAIAREMNYKNTDVVKTRKYYCLKEFSNAYKQLSQRA